MKVKRSTETSLNGYHTTRLLAQKIILYVIIYIYIFNELHFYTAGTSLRSSGLELHISTTSFR
jgi:hypothetical protein